MTQPVISPLTLADIPTAVIMEQAAYQAQWPRRDYAHELQHVSCARYYAAWSESGLIGIGGFWLIADEANLMTIAIDPAWQKRGLGAWLLGELLHQAETEGADGMTLEVRPSNYAALALYQRYGFEEAGRRPRYYDDGEAALIMTTPSFKQPDYQILRRRLREGKLKRESAK